MLKIQIDLVPYGVGDPTTIGTLTISNTLEWDDEGRHMYRYCYTSDSGIAYRGYVFHHRSSNIAVLMEAVMSEIKARLPAFKGGK